MLVAHLNETFWHEQFILLETPLHDASVEHKAHQRFMLDVFVRNYLLHCNRSCRSRSNAHHDEHQDEVCRCHGADLGPGGEIIFEGTQFKSPSAFSVHVKRKQNPGRKADDGW